MPGDSDQPESSLTTCSTNSETHEQFHPPSISTPQARAGTPLSPQAFDEHEQSDPVRRKLSNQELLSPAPQAGEYRPPSQQGKSPVYLQGRNPYGQVLDRIEHPYREPRNPTTSVARADGPPSQVGSSIEGRPRTAGSFQFKSRPGPAEPNNIVHAKDSHASLASSG